MAIWFEKFEEQLKNVPVYDNPRRRKRMWEDLVVGDTIEEGMILEFGVHTGGSIGWFPKKFDSTKVNIFGFDSFEGLPEDWDLGDKVLKKNHFSTKGVVPKIEGVKLIKGWFEDTLPEFLKNNKDVIKIVHLDCDLYSASKFVLTQVKSRLVPGSWILFDECTHNKGNPQYTKMREHEYKAFKEFCEETPDFDFKVVGRTTGPQVAVKVINI